MKLKDYERLRKLMQMTTSESDNECLQAIRGANRILASYSIDWDRVFARTVQVVNEFEPDPEANAPNVIDVEARKIDAAFATLEESDLGSFQEFVDSIKDQWTTNHSLSPGQKAALFRAAQKAERER